MTAKSLDFRAKNLGLKLLHLALQNESKIGFDDFPGKISYIEGKFNTCHNYYVFTNHLSTSRTGS